MSLTEPRLCARRNRCYQVRKLGLDKASSLRASRQGNLCDRCESEHAGAVRASNNSRWAHETFGAIEEHLVQKGREKVGFEASLWDLFELRLGDSWDSRGPEVAQVVSRLNVSSARKLWWMPRLTNRKILRFQACLSGGVGKITITV